MILVIFLLSGDRVVVHELPCRIFAPIPGLGITLSDYIFPGDTANDSLDAFRELLDINVEEKDIENTVERLPGKYYVVVM